MAHPDLRTFCVITEANDISKENLGKTIHDKTKPFFYSKDWSEDDYDPNNITYSTPALFVYEKPYVIKNLFTLKDSIEYKLQLLIVMDDHNYATDSEIKTDEQRLETVEIFEQCKLYLIDTLNYVYTAYTKIRDINNQIFVTQFQTKGMLMAGVAADINFNDNCLIQDAYWNGDIEIPTSDRCCGNYIKLINNVSSVVIPYSEHKMKKVSGVKIYSASGDQIEACVNINLSTKSVTVESNINFSNHNIVIFA